MSIIGVVVLALFSALFARLWYLQVAAADQFHAAATENAVRNIHVPAVRGRILDDKGNVLAENRVANVITVDRKIDDATRAKVLRRLAPVVGQSVKELRGRLGDPRISPYTAVPVATGVDYGTLAYIAEHKEQFPGVHAQAQPVRVYPNGNTAFHVLGYIGEADQKELASKLSTLKYDLGDKIGKSGVELTYESDLRGTPGLARVVVDSAGKVLHRTEVRAPKPGHDVRLTLDLGVQRAGRDGPRPGDGSGTPLQGHRVQGGVPDAQGTRGGSDRDGRVHRIARGPRVGADVEPQRVRERHPAVHLGPAEGPRQQHAAGGPGGLGLYVPGSTFKLVTAVAGLKAGLITPYSTIDDTGKYAYPTDPNFFFRGEGANGRVDLAHALTVSSDVYFYTIGGDLYYKQRHQQPGGDALQQTAHAFGFGEPTGVALPNEATGRVPDAAWKQKIHAADPASFPYPDWLPGDNIQSAIGQGDLLVTPMQLATAYATFANGGTRFSPRLADAVFDVRGHKVRNLPAIELGHVDIPNRDTLLAGFTGVVESTKGTAAGVFAGFPAGLAAGKTGTTQVAGKQNTSWFVGMTPAADPKYVVLAVVEEGGYGAQTAAPIVRAVMEQLNNMPMTPVQSVSPPTGN